jgi:cytoskeletal protein RodZ
MKKFGDLFSAQRKKKKISLAHASKELVIKEKHLEALENEDWQNLPEAAFARGYIKSYAQYLGLDPEYLLALYRREYDESKFPQKTMHRQEKRLFITPVRIINLTFIVGVFAFLVYIALQYASIFSSPKLDISSPKNDQTISVPAIQITGKTEKDATVSINGSFAPVNENGEFSQEYMLKDGKNTIEIIASFRLSPKNKITRTVRLIR